MDLEPVDIKPMGPIPRIRARLASLTDLIMGLYTEGVTLRFTGLLIGYKNRYFIIGFGRQLPRFHENQEGNWN